MRRTYVLMGSSPIFGTKYALSNSSEIAQSYMNRLDALS
ncbi:hypothetical protein NCTGTJJY_CDS0151 [Serratia phage 92A1]|nr:hypothetical protein NCTGTJJY_CDS0151 [Serratia phage 92A1]